CPLITYWSPSRVAVARKEARSDPASGSLKPWHQRSRPLIRPGRKRCWTASLACVVIPWTRYPRLGRGGAPAAASSSSTMTSKNAGRSWPPERESAGGSGPGRGGGREGPEDARASQRGVPPPLPVPVLVVGRGDRQTRIVL